MTQHSKEFSKNFEDIKFYSLLGSTPLCVQISFNVTRCEKDGNEQISIFDISNESMTSILDRYLYAYDLDICSDPREIFVELVSKFFVFGDENRSPRFYSHGINSNNLIFQDHYGQIVSVERLCDRLKWTVTRTTSVSILHEYKNKNKDQSIDTIDFDTNDLLKVAKLFIEGLVEKYQSDIRYGLIKKIKKTEVIQGGKEWSRKLTSNLLEDKKIYPIS